MVVKFIREIYKKRLRARLHNKDFSLIASNCSGMFMLKDLNLPYKSPFVNLWLYPKDFIKFLKNISYYSECKLEFIQMDNIKYPVGKLDDIHIFFQHYKTEEEAYDKWNKRIKRINKKNIYILMTDRDGCTEDDLREFDKLEYKNKKVFTHIEHPDISSAVYIPGFEKDESVGMCFQYAHKYSIKRRYDVFDYVSWFNSLK